MANQWIFPNHTLRTTGQTTMMEVLCQIGFSPIALFSLTSASSTNLKMLFQPEEMDMLGGVTYCHATDY